MTNQSNLCNLKTTKPITKFLYRVANMGLCGWSYNSPNKSKMADVSHLEFCKMLIFLYCMKILTKTQHSYIQLPCDQKCNLKLTLVTTSNKRQEQDVNLMDYERYFNEIWYRTHTPDYHHSGMCQIH